MCLRGSRGGRGSHGTAPLAPNQALTRSMSPLDDRRYVWSQPCSLRSCTLHLYVPVPVQLGQVGAACASWNMAPMRDQGWPVREGKPHEVPKDHGPCGRG